MTLQLDEFHIHIGRTCIVEAVTARFEQGQVVAVIGPNGAGKSTFLAGLAGQLRHGGRVAWNDKPMALLDIAYMPQNTDVRAGLSVMEVMLLGRMERLGWRVSSKEIEDAEAALERFGLNDLKDRIMPTLSGGQRQMVMLAQRLMRNPDLIILDEPTSALDMKHQMEVFLLLRAHACATGALALVAVHDVNLVARHCDSLLLFANGKLMASGPHHAVLNADNIRNAWGVEAEILQSSTGHPVFVPLNSHHHVTDDARDS